MEAKNIDNRMIRISQHIGLLCSFYLLFTDLLYGTETRLLNKLFLTSNRYAESFFAILAPALCIGLAAGVFYANGKRKLKPSSDAEHIFKTNEQIVVVELAKDVLVKLALLFAVTLAGSPSLVCSALVIFIADWVLQNRYFTLSKSLRIPIAIILIMIGTLSANQEAPSLIVPYSVFVAVSLASLHGTIAPQLKNNETTA